MTNNSIRSLLFVPCALAACASSAAAGATYRAISYLQGYSQPGNLAEVSPGVFYVTVSAPSVLISVTRQGTLSTLATFQPPYNMGSDPGVTAANGLFYSSIDQATTNGGSGNMFSVASTPGSEHTYPSKTLVMVPLMGNLPDGRLFGIAYNLSNASNNLATADLAGNVTPFYQFTDHPGLPIYGADGNYYGMADPGAGSSAPSYFYQVTPSGAFTKIANLPFLGGTFIGNLAGGGLLLQATDGNFYGIQQQSPGCSPENQHAAVFKLTPSGQFTLLHDFGPCNAVFSLIEGSDGKLYGSNVDNMLFSLTTAGVYAPVLQLSGSQGYCPCLLLHGSDGIIYGSTSGGGTTGGGVIFALDAGLPVPRPRAQSFSPQSGAPGTRVRIWGQNLFGASVEFNGVPAAQAVNSGPNYVWVNVPAGATTGPLTITTPGGQSTTRHSFTVN